MTIMHNVESSAISALGYDERESVLIVEFTHGRSYEYWEVPPSIAFDFIEADSVGKYYNAYIKGQFLGVEV